MAKFKFYQDQLVKVWERRSFSVEAETEEEAIKIAEDIAKENYQVYEDDREGIDFYESETLFDTEENLSPEENDGHFTMEIFLRSNTMKAVARNGKI